MWASFKNRLSVLKERKPIAFFFIANSLYIIGFLLLTFGNEETTIQSNEVLLDVYCFFILIIAFVLNFVTAMAAKQALSTIIKQQLSLTHLYYFFIITLSFITLNFTIVYGQLYLFDHNSFKGVNPENVFVDLYYYSVVTFATVGYGDITPNSYYAKFACTIEIFHSLLFLIFIISQFSKVEFELKKGLKINSDGQDLE